MRPAPPAIGKAWKDEEMDLVDTRRRAQWVALTACGAMLTGCTAAAAAKPALSIADSPHSVAATAIQMVALNRAPTVSPSDTVPCTGATPPARYDHVVLILMENKKIDAIGPKNAPVETALMRKCAKALHWVAPGARSLPNYLALTSGSTQGLQHNYSPDDRPVTADNIFRQVRAAGGTAKSYVESMPTNCAMTSTADYTTSHNPMLYFTGPGDRSACRNDDVPLGTITRGALHTDLADDTLPDLAFVVPNMTDDTHDSGVKIGDAWLKSWLPHLLNSAAYRDRSTAVFVLWDEYTPAPNILVSPSVVPGTVVTSPSGHYSALRAVEDMLGLPHLAAADDAPDLRGQAHL